MDEAGSRTRIQGWTKSFALGLLLFVTSNSASAQEALVASNALKGMSLQELMDIEVTTVARRDSTVGQSPAAIFVITSEMIRRSSATAIPELFRMVPGMTVARIDNNKWAVSARGFIDRFSGKLLVQLDGRVLYNPTNAGVYWDTVDYPLEDIERIEVIRGPGASVWGANAVNGVINIITKSAADTIGGLSGIGVGDEDRVVGVARYGAKTHDGLNYRVYTKGFDRDEQFTTPGSSDDAWWGASAGARIDGRANDRDTFTADVGYFHAVAGRRDFRPQSTPPFVFQNIEDEVTDGAHVLGRWSRALDGESSWALQAYWDRFQRDLTGLDLDLNWDTFDVDFQHQLPLGRRHVFLYGLGFRLLDSFTGNSGIDDGFFLTWIRNQRHLQTYSAFVQDEIALLPDKLSLTLGSKFEHNELTGFEVQPTARLLWVPTQRQSVWAAVSRAVRTPTETEDGAFNRLVPSSVAPPTFPRITANPDLDAETVLTYELGYRAQATDAISADVALFYSTYDHLVSALGSPVQPGPNGTFFIPVVRQNGLDGTTHGAELALGWRVSELWRLTAAYSFLEMQLHRDPGFAASAEAAEGQSPEQQASLQSSWNLRGNVELDLSGRFVDKTTGFNPSNAPGFPNTIDAYVSLDARLAWRPRSNWELTLVGQNLLDDHHPEFGTSPQVRSPLVEIQRALYGRLEISW